VSWWMLKSDYLACLKFVLAYMGCQITYFNGNVGSFWVSGLVQCVWMLSIKIGAPCLVNLLHCYYLYMDNLYAMCWSCKFVSSILDSSFISCHVRHWQFPF
jgi:hypothetical protein